MDPNTGTGDGTTPNDDSTVETDPETTHLDNAPATESNHERPQTAVNEDETDTTVGTEGRNDDSDRIPAIVPLTDARGDWPSMSTDDDPATREMQRDLTPDGVTIDRPDEFKFEYILTEDLPTGVQYTPDFDPDWVYPSGSEDGGRQDDTPVQGLEIGVIGTEATVEATVRSVLNAISLYYDDTGQYPRHRIVKSASTFEEYAADGVGLVAVLQPSPDDHDGLMDHMQTVQSNADGAVDSNVETSRRLVQYLGAQLVADGTGAPAGAVDVVAATGWDTAAQIGTLPIVERYAPLGAAEVYDPAIEGLDLSEDGVQSVADTDFTPRRLAIGTNAELFEPSDDHEDS